MGFILWGNRWCGFTNVQRSLQSVIWILLGEITNIKEESTTNIFFLHIYMFAQWYQCSPTGFNSWSMVGRGDLGPNADWCPWEKFQQHQQPTAQRVSRVGLRVCFSPAGRGWCACWGNWSVCWATELSPSETDTYSVASAFRRPPGSLSPPPDPHPRGWTGADGGADMQLWETEKGLTTCG